MPAQDADSGETWYSDNKEGTYSDMDVIDDYETKYSGQVEIPETLDVPEGIRTYEYLGNQIIHQSEDRKDTGEFEDENQDLG